MVAFSSAVMNHQQFKSGRLGAQLTQVQAAERLGLSQSYLSQLEKGQRPVTPEIARLATKLYRLSPAALPLPDATSDTEESDAARLARQLSGLGYPGFAHLRGERINPAVLVLQSLVHDDLEVRLTEALPWVLATYPDVDWSWLTDQAKLKDVQNRLGFLVALARELAKSRETFRSALEPLQQAETKLERARLAREDTLCRESMPGAERRWLAANRSPLARHWNLLTGLTVEQLPYAS
jgi:transcriptional regulator with XRE-family HTH domain